ncbi:MAG: acetylglutamate kinase [Oceanicaulis sp.]|uniref:Acetylglutamate kinase n=1 Tax=Maricaulis virginensis TaxID=144022 RepID=A0A9W6ILW0_9PROT|nr:acetylglutamate kinase [Maricaulis virginensis]MAC39143.1 acetylglutamate kinase [Oceanicaulis sp.]MAZ90989.1 acetylglutamate kinase [Maricaulis sp.]MBI74001.1 acetylglutamate kinase [Oceanicaulis sp.]GLK51904.1 acetylglutamate kinase [Maricaulis virginensis]
MSGKDPVQPPVRQTIVQLLSHMRDGKEIREYLHRFSGVDQERFAVIKVGGAVIQDDLDGLASALAFLQTVGLTPVVVHGGGPQLDAALDAAGIATERINGLRVTREPAIPIIRDTLTEANLALVDAIRAAGGRAAAIPRGVFEAELVDEKTLGRVGEPSRVRLDLVAAAARAGQASILACLGETADGCLVNVNADTAVRALVHALQPYKVVFLTGTGGLLDEDGDILSSINLATDFAELMDADWVNGGMRLKLEEIKRLLDDLPLSSSVSITRPAELARELFTHAGAGTLIRRGERIKAASSKDELDIAKLDSLVTKAFGRPPIAGYWDSLVIDQAFVTDSYRAAALTTRLDDWIYLDKFAVLDDARGEGLGRAVWHRLVEYAPRLIWRSRTSNPVNGFYFDECDGAVRRDEWTVFWRGEDVSLTGIDAVVEKAFSLPPTLEAPK